MNRFNVLYIWLLVFSVFSCSSKNDLDAEVDVNLSKNSDYLIVFGDLQVYTENPHDLKYFEKSVNWLSTQINGGINIIASLQVGDVTEANREYQWKNFYDVVKKLNNQIPFFTCTGNHDYNWNNFIIKNRDVTLITKYGHFPLVDNQIVCYYENNSLENYIAYLPEPLNAYLIVLEFGPRKEVLEWAIKYVNNHEDDRFILMTHEWLTHDGERVGSGSYAEAQFSGYSSFSSPEDIWLSLVKPNDNIICVLCGHNGFSAKLFSENDSGRMVPQILFNLQYQDNGGNGLVQVWEFPSGSVFVNICAYDTINKKWYMPDSTSVSFKFKY